MEIRRLRDDETELLKDFLYEAIFIPEEAAPPDRSIILLPELSLYYEGFGKRPGDYCLAAEDCGKVVGAVGTVTGTMGKAFTAIGAFSAKVTLAGGGLGGFIKTLVSSKVAMAALAAALVYGAVKLVDYASGAKAAREALEGMAKTARTWKETAADTLYGSSQGLAFFGMSNGLLQILCRRPAR